MYEHLKILHWPDPRLTRVSEAVTTFDARLRELVERMFQLMREFHGVGLAAPQVGENIRLFVMNHSGQPGDDRVYVNPVLSEGEGSEEGEEGCLSLPDIRIKVIRSKTLRIEAQDLEGKPFTQTESGYITRIWQHEFDHLNGVLLTDKMGPATKLLCRKTLRKLQDEYAPPTPIKARLRV